MYAITAGEPAGIGPDIVVELAQASLPDDCVVIANADLLRQRAEMLGITITIHHYQADKKIIINRPHEITVIDVPLDVTITPGHVSTASADYVIATLQRAIDGALSGEFKAIITGPVHKGILNDAGISFSGHTEFFAEACGIEKPVMMLANEQMRVCLVSIHVSIRNLPSLITLDNIQRTIKIVHNDLQQKFNIHKPRIAVLALNPHAGENGHLGSEENDIIIPAIEQLKEQGYNLTGPMPADTAFHHNHLEKYDAFIAMYHDQALPVVKFADFERTVNVTLGLPVIRTSVDHGTACHLTGTGKAEAINLAYAIDYAISMVNAT